MIKKIGAMQARQRLGQILNEVRYGKDYYIIERDGQGMVAVIPLSEFEFMQKLIKGEPERRVQAKFFKEHIEKWVPLFCQKIGQETKSGFYKEIADLTVDFIDQEKEGFKNDGKKDINN